VTGATRHVERVRHHLAVDRGDGGACLEHRRAVVTEARGRRRPSGLKNARTRSTSPRPAAQKRSGSTPACMSARAQS
jgi:hypothetical protein